MGFGEQWKRANYFRGTGKQRPNSEGNRGTKTELGNREQKKTIFCFSGNRDTSQFITGEQVPPAHTHTWEGLASMRDDIEACG